MPLYMLQQHAERIAGVPVCQQTIWILGAQRHSLLLLPPPLDAGQTPQHVSLCAEGRMGSAVTVLHVVGLTA